ncbi:hypothetical protein ACOMHN_020469 [Nucella lapillus]
MADNADRSQQVSTAINAPDLLGESSAAGISNKETEKGVRLCMLTWNVGGGKPPVSMEDALCLTQAPLPDMFGIGLQEVSPKPSDSKDWIDMFTWTLADYDYVRVKVRQQLGVVTMVFIQRSLLSFCTSFESEITKTGLGGWWGNKGGVSIRLDILGINLIIVNCHLAAHLENVAERIIDYDSILDDQKFKDPDVENILDHDYVFWMGDTNFRIDNMSRGEVERAIQSKNYKKLLDNDQLNRCREEKLIFEDFEEMDITFPPTYKFDQGTNIYDTSSKQRVPSWCDRVLWHKYNTDYDSFQLRVDPLAYASHPKYSQSDHKPVTANFFFTTFPSPPLNPVQFKQQTRWRMEQDAAVEYCVSRHLKTSDSDWIGLYKANFHKFDKFISYTWALSGAEKNRQGVIVTFSARSLTVKPGRYCLCYLNRKYSLMGISNTFQEIFFGGKEREVNGYENLEVNGYENLEVNGYENLEVNGYENLEVNGYENLEGNGYENLEGNGYENLEVNGYENLEGNGYENLEGNGYENLEGNGYQNLKGNGYQNLEGNGYQNFEGNGYENLEGNGYENLEGNGYDNLEGNGYQNLKGNGYQNLEVNGYENLEGNGYENLEGNGYENLEGNGYQNLKGNGYQNLEGNGYQNLEGNGYENLEGNGYENLEGNGYENLEGNGYENLEGNGYQNLKGNGYQNLEVNGYENLEGNGYENLEGNGYENLEGNGYENLEGNGYQNLKGNGYQNLEGNGYENLEGNGYENLEGNGYENLEGNGYQNLKGNGYQNLEGNGYENLEGMDIRIWRGMDTRIWRGMDIRIWRGMDIRIWRGMDIRISRYKKKKRK